LEFHDGVEMTNLSGKPTIPLPLETAALLVGCLPEEILSLRTTAEGGLMVIAPSGRKLAFSASQVKEARSAVSLSAAETHPVKTNGRKRAGS
jgi:hypothetical protein